ncbi:DMT family transporter [Affinibrenneria salicis]|uniref:DMT family transporter n=1 Tax=Affinibrenneria salicis TaxID=2590031 RepID=A0A5J5FQ76_9GAMM|nr:DMT family transporter [Affinibrenneria salicis]KAA8994933.1 DMT family transporter [Affinibrenneria salicis]
MNRTSLWVKGLFLLAPLLFASNMVAARWINAEFPPVSLAFGRWLLAALLLLPFVLPALRQCAPLMRRRAGDLALLALLGGALSVAPQYAAAHYTHAGHIALIFALSPVLVALIERLIWKVALSPAMIVGAGIAFAGIGVAVFEGSLAHLSRLALNRGDVIAFIAALAWAGYTALLRRRPVNLPPLVLLWIVAGGGALALLPFTPVEWWLSGAVPHFSLRIVGGMFFVALVAGIAAYLVYARIVAAFGAARASTSMYLVPVFAFLLGALLLDERLQFYHVIATLMVFAGVALATIKSAGQKRAPSYADVSPLSRRRIGKAA